MISRHIFSLFSKAKARSYYQILEVPVTASAKDIKGNFIRLAKLYHPDIYKGNDKTRFTKIKEAYETLINQEKRSKYDEELGMKKKEDGEQKNEEKPERTPEDYPTHKVKVDYSINTDTIQDIDKEYEQFFKKKVSTPFQQIRTFEQPQFRQMTQEQRLRRRFKQIHNQPIYGVKTIHQHDTTFQQILDDQIKMQNLHVQQIKQEEKKHQYRQTEEYKVKKLRQLKILMGSIALLFFPTLFSILTRKKRQKDTQDKFIKELDEMIENTEMEEVKSRIRF